MFTDIVTIVFQSTCPRGARPPHTTHRHSAQHFNPRAHEGHDKPSGSSSSVSGYFNPRAHEGHDAIYLISLKSSSISIHVPTRGTTALLAGSGSTQQISIHVPTRGTTANNFAERGIIPFQSTCPRGARRKASIPASKFTYFNPRAHEGHDLVISTWHTVVVFQSTCPRGARLSTIIL